MRALLLLPLLLGACNANAVFQPEGPVTADGYSLTADRSAYEPGDTVTLTLHNDTDEPADTGVMGCARLEQRTEAGWTQDLPFNERACIMMAVIVEPGDAYTGEVDLDGVGAGTYRFVHSANGVEVATASFVVA